MLLQLNIKGSTSRGKLIKVLTKDISVASNDKPLLLSGCPSCQETPETNVIECPICKDKYHTLCLTNPIPADLLTYQSTNPSLWWFCPACIVKSQEAALANEKVADNLSHGSDAEVKHYQDLDCKLNDFKTQLLNSVNTSFDQKLKAVNDKLDSKLNSLFDKLPDQEAISNLSEKVTNASTLQKPVENAAPTFPTVQEKPTVMILTPSNTSSPSKVKSFAKKLSDNLKDVPVAFLKVNEDNGKVVAGFPNLAEKEKGEKLIKDAIQATNSNYAIKTTEKMLPKLTIWNVPIDIVDDIPNNSNNSHSEKQATRDLIKERIVDSIKRKNHAIKHLVDDGHTVEVVYVEHTNDNTSLTLGVKVSPAIRLALINGQSGRIYIGDRAHQFSDRYHFKVCYHCQSIGHVSADCPRKHQPPVCFYCGESHKSKECTDKHNLSKRNCANCSKSQVPRIARESHTHNAASPNCPITIKEIKRLENNTDLTSKNLK